MDRIWIVEYGFNGIGDADCFSAAFSTWDKAVAYARRGAAEQKADLDWEEETYEIVETIEDDEWKFCVGDSDWYIVREVPFDR